MHAQRCSLGILTRPTRVILNVAFMQWTWCSLSLSDVVMFGPPLCTVLMQLPAQLVEIISICASASASTHLPPDTVAEGCVCFVLLVTMINFNASLLGALF